MLPALITLGILLGGGAAGAQGGRMVSLGLKAKIAPVIKAPPPPPLRITPIPIGKIITPPPPFLPPIKTIPPVTGTTLIQLAPKLPPVQIPTVKFPLQPTPTPTPLLPPTLRPPGTPPIAGFVPTAPLGGAPILVPDIAAAIARQALAAGLVFNPATGTYSLPGTF